MGNELTKKDESTIAVIGKHDLGEINKTADTRDTSFQFLYCGNDSSKEQVCARNNTDWGCSESAKGRYEQI